MPARVRNDRAAELRRIFGQRIRQARLDLSSREGRDISIAEIARTAGVSPATLGQWEAGAKEPKNFAAIEQVVLALEPANPCDLLPFIAPPSDMRIVRHGPPDSDAAHRNRAPKRTG